jgi:hypothetical protein
VNQADRAIPGLSSLDTLQQFADLTGGQWFPSEALDQALRQATSEGRGMYRIGYRPPIERWNNKFHNLRISAEGKGGIGLRVRTIDGYFGDALEADPRESFQQSAVGQTDDSAIAIRATASSSDKGKRWIRFEVRVNATDLLLTQGETYTGGFALSFASYTTGWQTDLIDEIPIALNLTASEHDAILRNGIVLSFERTVRPGTSKVRIVVRDPQSGAVGSLTVPVAAASKQ